MGILFALTALFSWGIGDFLIQRTVRKFGDWVALFYIGLFGTLALFPFVYGQLGAALSLHGLLICLTSAVIFGAALLDFEALRVGKISVVEPIYALEVLVTALLSTYILRETLTVLQILLLSALLLGIVLVGTKSLGYFKKMRLEKGLWYALFAALAMGIANFLFGFGSREISPLLINWFTHAFVTFFTFMYLLFSSRVGELVSDLQRDKRLVLTLVFFDNLAWIAFSYATLYIPIAVATGISESYIVVASGLGLIFNKEKLKPHQMVGLFLAVSSVVILAYIMDK